jgi:hypothetical protein
MLHLWDFMACAKLKFMMQCETLKLTKNHAQYWGKMTQGSKVMDNFETEVTHTSNHSLCLLFKLLHVQESWYETLKKFHVLDPVLSTWFQNFSDYIIPSESET